MNTRKATIAALAWVCVSLCTAKDGVSLNKEGQAYEGLNIGYLHMPGWTVLSSSDAMPEKGRKTVTFDSGGVRIGEEWIGQIYFDQGKLLIKNKEKKYQLLKGSCELGVLRVKIILESGEVVHFGRISC